MTSASKPIPRKAWWAVLLIAALLGLVAGGSSIYRQYLTDHWATLRLEQEEDLRSDIQNAFRREVDALADIAGAIVADTVTLDGLISNRPQAVTRAFRRLSEFQSEPDIVLEVTDANGALVGWSGAKGVQRFEWFTGAGEDTVVALSPSGLRSYLSVGIQVKKLGLVVVASRPFEVNTAVSARFVRSGSFRQRLEAALSREIVIIGAGNGSSTSERRLRVGLTDRNGALLSTVLVDAPTLETEIQDVEFFAESVMGGILSLCALALVLLLVRRFPPGLPGAWFRLPAVLAAVWLVRYVWLWAEFPSSLMGGWLFSPAHYASPFAGGLASSLGDLSISVMTLLVSAILIVRELPEVNGEAGTESHRVSGKTGFFAGGLVVLLGVNVILR